MTVYLIWVEMEVDTGLPSDKEVDDLNLDDRDSADNGTLPRPASSPMTPKSRAVV